MEDTRTLQKEINAVRDHLGRTYAVADEMIFSDAKRDREKGSKDTAKTEIYKQLVAINEGFEKLVTTIEEIGQTRGSILSLESKIDQVTSRTSSQNMDRITEDLKQIREANDALEAKIHGEAK